MSKRGYAVLFLMGAGLLCGMLAAVAQDRAPWPARPIVPPEDELPSPKTIELPKAPAAPIAPLPMPVTPPIAPEPPPEPIVQPPLPLGGAPDATVPGPIVPPASNALVPPVAPAPTTLEQNPSPAKDARAPALEEKSPPCERPRTACATRA